MILEELVRSPALRERARAAPLGLCARRGPHGDADPSVPVRQSRELARRIPHARVVELPGERHLLLLDHVGDVFDALGLQRPAGSPHGA